MSKHSMWSIPVGLPVVTIYFQGLANTQVSAALYCAKLSATTGENVCFPGALPLLFRPWIGKELDEVDLESRHGWQCYLNWLYNWYTGYQFSPASKLRWHSVRLKHSNLGQVGDMIEHAQKVASAPDAELILFGFSRGAAATFCAMAHYRYPRVRLVILESIIHSSKANIKQLPWVHALKMQLLTPWFAAAHDPDGVAPIDLVDRFPHVPVVMIALRGDDTAHVSGQRKLATALAQRGVPVHLLVLDADGHYPIPLLSNVHRHRALIFLHAIYRHYALPHIEPLANEGEPLLAATHL